MCTVYTLRQRIYLQKHHRHSPDIKFKCQTLSLSHEYTLPLSVALSLPATAPHCSPLSLSMSPTSQPDASKTRQLSGHSFVHSPSHTPPIYFIMLFAKRRPCHPLQQNPLKIRESFNIAGEDNPWSAFTISLLLLVRHTTPPLLSIRSLVGCKVH